MALPGQNLGHVNTPERPQAEKAEHSLTRQKSLERRIVLNYKPRTETSCKAVSRAC